MRKLYEILDVPLGSAKPALKKKYHSLALKHHPDRGGDEERFKEITLAYEILSGKRKPNRHETAKYGDSITQTVRRNTSPRRDSSPPQQPITVWPPPHMKEHWKRSGNVRADGSRSQSGAYWRQPERKESDIVESKAVREAEKRRKEELKQVRCYACNGSGKEVRTCIHCYGTGNIVGQQDPTPLVVAKCEECKGRGKVQTNSCYKCKGTGKS